MTRFALTVVLLGFAGAAARADVIEPEPAEPDPTGTQFFRGLLAFAGVRPLATPDGIIEDAPVPEDRRERALPEARGIILIVVGVPRRADPNFNLAALSARVLRDGGAVLIATENPASLADFFPDAAPLSVVGEKAFTLKESSRFNANGWCGFAMPTRNPDDPGFGRIFNRNRPAEPDWFDRFPRVATNRPSGLVLREGSKTQYVRPVGRLPKSARIGGPEGQNWPTDRYLVTAGAGPDTHPFRAAVVADTSVFINQMMTAPDPGDPTRLGTDNLAFAVDLLDWLRGPERRSACLFVENGDIIPEFDELKFSVPADDAVPPVPVPNIDLQALERRVLDGVTDAIDKFQAADHVNRFLARDESRFSQMLQIVAAGAAAVFAFFLLSRTWASRHRPDVPPPPKPPVSRGAGLADRGAELARSADVSGPVRGYVRLLFVGRGLPGGRFPRKMPPVEVTGPGRAQLRADLRELWDLATADPQPLNFARWKELEPVIEAVRRAGDRGQWRFLDGPPNLPPAAPTPVAPGGAA